MYVCTGNQCRSVMAEYYTRAKLADRGIACRAAISPCAARVLCTIPRIPLIRWLSIC
ncbi:MAG: hypothetical protein ACLSST_09520 [Bifidobacterium dentium]